MKKTYKAIYRTPRVFSDMLMMSDGDVLTGLHFIGSRKVAGYCRDCEERGDREKARDEEDVRTGCRRRGGMGPYLHHHSMPPSYWRERRACRLRRRNQ